MSLKNHNEFTIDDILAEFDDEPVRDKPSEDTPSQEPVNETTELKEELASLRAEVASLKAELASLKSEPSPETVNTPVNTEEPPVQSETPAVTLDPDSDEDSPDEDFDPDNAEIAPVEPIIDAAPAALYSETEIHGETAFGTAEAAPEEQDEDDTLQDEINEIISSIWAPSVEVISEDEGADEAAFTEELEEEEASEKLIAQQTDSEESNEIIEEDDNETVSAQAAEETVPAREEAPPVRQAEEKSKEMSYVPVPSEEKKDLSAENEKKPFWQGIIPWKGDSIFEIIRKIIFIVAVAVFIGAGIMLITTLGDSQKAVSDANENKDIIVTTVATTIDENGNIITVAPTEDEIIEHNINVMEKYKEISENVIGYIELEGCDIYQPIVQGEDNDYYLTHTYYDEKNKGGSIFADYRCRIEDGYTSPNLVLYGHNQEDGTMFGNLKNYKQNLEFYAENPVVTIGTDYGVSKYLIYGFFVTNALENQDTYGEVFHYHDYIEVMNDETTFNWYLNEVKERNQIISPVKVEFGDELLCLSTCSNEFSNSRFVVFARKLREGESVEDYDFTDAYFNPNARGVDWEAILSGETSEESTEESLESEEEITDEEVQEEEPAETEVPADEVEDSGEAETVTASQKVTERTLSADETAPVTEAPDPDAVPLTDRDGNAVTLPPYMDENGNIIVITAVSEADNDTQ